jgi:outer membrane lipoprotein-sorting protein
MHCQHPKAYLSKRAGPVERLLRRAHLLWCAECRCHATEWFRLSRQLDRLEGEPVPPGLQERVMADAQAAAVAARALPAPPPVRARRMMMRRAVLVGAFVVLLVTTGFWFLSGRRQDSALAQVAEAMAKVKSAHLVGWWTDSRTGEKQRIEAWVKGPDKFRFTLEGREDAADDGEKLVSVTTVNGVTTAVLQPSGRFPGSEAGLTYLDLFTDPQGLEAGLKATGSELAGWRSGTLPDGQSVEFAEIESQAVKMELAFDARSKLLVQWEVHNAAGKLVQKLEQVEYDVEIPDSVFAVSLPEGVTVTDLRVAPSADVTARRAALLAKLRESPTAFGAANGPGGDLGSEFHDGLRFRCLSGGEVHVFYLTDRNAYFVVGKVLVYDRESSFRRIVEDGELAAPRPPDHSLAEVRQKLFGPPTPPEVLAKRDALVRQVEQSGGVLIGHFGRGGECGSAYHAGLRFQCQDHYDYGIRVYYLPHRNAYYVVGKALVYSKTDRSFRKEVEDAEIAAPGPPRQPD